MALRTNDEQWILEPKKKSAVYKDENRTPGVKHDNCIKNSVDGLHQRSQSIHNAQACHRLTQLEQKSIDFSAPILESSARDCPRNPGDSNKLCHEFLHDMATRASKALSPPLLRFEAKAQPERKLRKWLQHFLGKRIVEKRNNGFLPIMIIQYKDKNTENYKSAHNVILQYFQMLITIL